MINEQGHIVLDADGGKVLRTIKQIDNEARALKGTLRNLEINSEQFKKTTAAIQEMDKVKRNLNQTLSGTNRMWENIKGQMISVGAVALGFLGFSFLTSQIGGMIRKNAELSDSLATIRQKTGMTQEEVEKLNAAFGRFDTRTATKELRAIATELGALGISKDKIADTTQAIDKLSVALEGEFANAAEVTKVTGTLRNVLLDIKTDAPDQDMLHLGNALLELGNAGLATAPVVSDIATRIGAVGGAMGLTAGEVLGISASLQELGLTAERGGTATGKILQKMTSNVAEFAKIAGVPIQEFTKMLNTDLYGAFKAVMTGSQKSTESATALAAMLKDAELSGAGASEVFLKLGKNAELMDEKVQLASKALGETGKIMDAFALKNETLGAKLEKLGKIFYGILANNGITKFFESMVDGFLRMAEKTNETEAALTNYNKAADEFKSMSDKLNPLIDRYDVLKAKTTLSKDEQTELNKIIKQVSEIAPSAITAFNDIGGAMDISSGKARELLERMSLVKETLNADSITKYQEAYDKEVAKGIELYKKLQEETEKTYKMQKDPKAYMLQNTSYGDYGKTFATLLDEQNKKVLQLGQEWKKTQDEALKYQATIDHLSGKDVLKDIPTEKGKTGTTGTTGTNGGIIPTKEEIEAAKKALEDYVKDTARIIEQLREAQAQNVDDDMQRELALLEVKTENSLKGVLQYEQEVKAKAQAGVINKTEEAKALAVSKELKLQMLEEYQNKAEELVKKFNDKLTAEHKKQIDDEFKLSLENLHNMQAARRTELKQRYIQGTITEKQYNDALAALKLQELEEEKTAYEDYGKDITDIDEKITDAKITNANKAADANTKAAKKSLEEWEKFLKESAVQLQAWGTVVTDIVGSFNDMQVSEDEEVFRAKKKTAEKQINDARAYTYEQISLAEQQYKKGAISKEVYDNIKAVSEEQLATKINELNAGLDAESRKINYEQAKRAKQMAEFQAAIQGAAAIVKAFLEGGPVLAGFTAAAVALQIAAIEARPLPEYAVGGKTRVTGDSGRSYDTNYVGSIAKGGHYSTPSLGIISENGPEYVIPNWIYTMPQMANVIGMLEALRVRGYAAGGATGAEVTDAGGANNESMAMLTMAINRLVAKLNEPIEAEINYDKLNYDLNKIESALNTGKLRSS